MAQEDQRRTYPLKKPRDHKAPVTRWTLRLPKDVSHIYTLYIGVQSHGDDSGLRLTAERTIDDILLDQDPLPVVDTFRVTNGFDIVDSRVWVMYFTKEEHFATSLQKLNLTKIWREIGEGNDKVGLWIEHFAAPVERLETNYARLDHKPGLAQLPGIEQVEHGLTAYWGAGRDRIPASAHDLFLTPEDIPVPTKRNGFGERLTGTNYDNMCHIRSGQWWELCNDEERISYETNLQEKLMGGMQFLWDHPEQTGTIGLRFLQNLDAQGELIKETCGAGFHKNWSDLETWSSRHPSHLAIFNGMMAHAKKFGEDRKFMTWHEVWIFKAGEAHFEYVNCDPRTGCISWIQLDSESIAA